MARCPGIRRGSQRRWLLRAMAGLTAGLGLCSLVVPASAAGPPPLPWVALGDSFSAGTGLGTVTAGCDRDAFAYAPRAARDVLATSYTVDLAHLACSGARVGDVWESRNEQNAAKALVTRLGDTIYWAVRRANELLPSVHGKPGNVHFVDWRTGTRQENAYAIPAGLPDAGPSFASYVSPDGLCNTAGRTPFLNGYVDKAPVNPERGDSFHPGSTGYWAAAVLTASSIRRDVVVSAG